MAADGLAGRVQTVLGTIDPDEMGVTLPHEHLFADITTLVEAPYEASQRGRAYQPVSLENLGWIRYNYFRNYDNALLTDEGTALSELDLFHRAGGTTIVDVTTVGIGRDPIALARGASTCGFFNSGHDGYPPLAPFGGQGHRSRGRATVCPLTLPSGLGPRFEAEAGRGRGAAGRQAGRPSRVVPAPCRIA